MRVRKKKKWYTNSYTHIQPQSTSTVQIGTAHGARIIYFVVGKKTREMFCPRGGGGTLLAAINSLSSRPRTRVAGGMLEKKQNVWEPDPGYALEVAPLFFFSEFSSI